LVFRRRRPRKKSTSEGGSTPNDEINVELSTPAPSAGLTVTLSTSSTGGGFSTSSGGPFTATLTLPTISSNSSSSASLYYEDTVAGSPTLTASASGWGSATLPTTVSAGPLKTIKVSPSPVTLAEGGTQLFTASGVDAYGNSVSISPSWTTTVPVGRLNPGSGTPATLETTSGGNGLVTATQGSVSGSATVTVTAQSTLSVTVKAGALSGSRDRYEVPLTVAADSATSNAAVSGASVTLQVFTNATCTGGCNDFGHRYHRKQRAGDLRFHDPDCRDLVRLGHGDRNRLQPGQRPDLVQYLAPLGSLGSLATRRQDKPAPTRTENTYFRHVAAPIAESSRDMPACQGRAANTLIRRSASSARRRGWQTHGGYGG